MRIVRRILITIVVTLALVFIGIYYVSPVALSFYGSSKAIPITRIVPADLTDLSVSSSPGAKLSYLGYEFDVPWNDLDESKTLLFPKDQPEKTRVILTFKSGLRLMATKCAPHEMADTFMHGDIKMTPAAFAAAFGPQAANSDYEFTKRVLEFSPDRMHHWALGPPIHARELVLLMTKSLLPSKPAESGIFNVHNAIYQGFQQGNPEAPSAKQEGVLLTLYATNDTFEVLFAQKESTRLITQPEINQIIQTLHRAEPGTIAVSPHQ